MLYVEAEATPRASRGKETAVPQVNFRTSSERLAIIDRAAGIRGVSRTEFVLRSSEAAAIEVLNEHPVNALDDDAWDDFVAALVAPVEIDPAVKARCYARKPQWNRWDRPSRSRRATTSRSSPRASPPSTPGSAARQG